MPGTPYYAVKRLGDVLLALLLGLPVLLIISICCGVIMLESKGSALFTQTRAGYKGKLFTIYKLRTMHMETTAADGSVLTDAERMTRSGRIIRKLSLDELPQLWNVLRGQMSFIGPRPLLPQYLPLYTPEQNRRHDVLPGISGWAQVNGRNGISWEEKFALDVYYVEHISLRLDAAILWRTCINVLQRDGVNASEDTTMQAFTGSGEK